MKKFYVIVLIFLSCSPSEILSVSKTKKKSNKTTTESTATSTSQPAIIAIEIVDPNENSTSAKQSKRTIEGSLGYGYNSFDESKPHYEVYKYSQHDIPPFKGDASHIFKGSSDDQVNIQKSVQYLPSISQQVSANSNLLQPGTTLYSSLSDQGHVGSLSTRLPEAPTFENDNVPVPVVVLRIYPHQLKDSTIQAKLPKSHPFAKNINSLNIQALLLKYIKTLKNPGTLSQYSSNQDVFENNHGSRNQYSSHSASYVKGHSTSNQYSGSQGSFGNNHGFNRQHSANDGSFRQYHGSTNKYAINQPSIGKNKGYSSQYRKNQDSSGHNTYSSNKGYSLPISSSVKPSSVPSSVKPTQVSYQTSKYNYNQDGFQHVPMYISHNGGAQNNMYYQQSYPQQSTQDYTRQNQYQQQQYPSYDSGVTVVEAPVKYEINPYQIGNQWRYETTAIQKPQTAISSSPQPSPQPEYYYVQPNTQNSYATEASQYYQPTQQQQYDKPASTQTVAVSGQQYYMSNADPQYSGYHQDAGQQYEDNSNQKLLTFENYPTTKHTRVVFKTKSGAIRTAEPEETPAKEIKTIKIHVPESIANVEVQETDRPYDAPEAAAYTDVHQQGVDRSPETNEQSGVALQNSYYVPSNENNQGYYNNENSASNAIYNYQSVNLEDMAKYFKKRGAMPQYFFQSPDETNTIIESSTEMTQETKDIISTYEEASFPSTTASPFKKKVKSKKGTPM